MRSISEWVKTYIRVRHHIHMPAGDTDAAAAVRRADIGGGDSTPDLGCRRRWVLANYRRLGGCWPGRSLCDCAHVDASAGEICRFAGTTDYAGHVAVTTGVDATDDVTEGGCRCHVRGDDDALGSHPLSWSKRSGTWRAGELESVAVEQPLFDWRPHRQAAMGRFSTRRGRLAGPPSAGEKPCGFPPPASWLRSTLGSHDVRPTLARQLSDRVTRASCRSRPQGFAASAGTYAPRSPWPSTGSDGYRAVVRTRRVLPGFKGERLVDLPIVASSSSDGTVARTLALLRSEREAGFECHGLDVYRSICCGSHSSYTGRVDRANGLINQEGCEGAPVVPADRPR